MLKKKIGGVEVDAALINLAWYRELVQLFPNTTPKRGALPLHILHLHDYKLEQPWCGVGLSHLWSV